MPKRSIPLKNYLLLLLILLATVLLVFYLASWYNTSKEYYQNNSILKNYLSELKSDEISSYLLDNPEIVIYLASGKDESIKNFEKDFKKLIEEYEIIDDIIYIDVNQADNGNLLDNINKISKTNFSKLTIPNLIYIKDAQVNKVLYQSDKEISKNDVRNFLIRCGIITDD